MIACFMDNSHWICDHQLWWGGSLPHWITVLWIISKLLYLLFSILYSLFFYIPHTRMFLQDFYKCIVAFLIHLNEVKITGTKWASTHPLVWCNTWFMCIYPLFPAGLGVVRVSCDEWPRAPWSACCPSRHFKLNEFGLKYLFQVPCVVWWLKGYEII